MRSGFSQHALRLLRAVPRPVGRLAARARHLFSVAPMPAFSVASRPSNSSDIMRSGFRHHALRLLRAVPRPVGRLLSAPGSKWCRHHVLPRDHLSSFGIDVLLEARPGAIAGRRLPKRVDATRLMENDGIQARIAEIM